MQEPNRVNSVALEEMERHESPVLINTQRRIDGKIILSKHWFLLFNIVLAISVNLGPLLAEFYTLSPNIKALVRQSNWIILASEYNNIVVCLPRYATPHRVNPTTATSASSWAVDFSLGTTGPEPRIQCKAISKQFPNSNEKFSWEVARMSSVEPGFIVKATLLFFLVLRWLFPVIRMIRFIVQNDSKLFLWKNTFSGFFYYISFFVFSLALIGTQIEGCIEWWALGAYGSQSFDWQVTYWMVTTIATILFITIRMSARCTVLPGAMSNRPTVPSFRQTPELDNVVSLETQDSLVVSSSQQSFLSKLKAKVIEYYCAVNRMLECSNVILNDPFLGALLIFFTGTAFVGSFLVLTYGMYKSWIFPIWIYFLLVIGEVYIRNRVMSTALYEDSCNQRRIANIYQEIMLEFSDLESDDSDSNLNKKTSKLSTRICRPKNQGDNNEKKIKKRKGVVYVKPLDEQSNLYHITSKKSSIVKTDSNTYINNNYMMPDHKPENTSTIDEEKSLSRSISTSHVFPTCIVCLEKPVDVIAENCAHGVMCVTCCKAVVNKAIRLYNEEMKRIQMNSRSRPPAPFEINCPLCRAKITKFYRFHPPNNSEGRTVCIWVAPVNKR